LSQRGERGVLGLLQGKKEIRLLPIKTCAPVFPVIEIQKPWERALKEGHLPLVVIYTAIADLFTLFITVTVSP